MEWDGWLFLPFISIKTPSNLTFWYLLSSRFIVWQCWKPGIPQPRQVSYHPRGWYPKADGWPAQWGWHGRDWFFGWEINNILHCTVRKNLRSIDIWIALGFGFLFDLQLPWFCGSVMLFAITNPSSNLAQERQSPHRPGAWRYWSIVATSTTCVSLPVPWQ